MSVIQNAALRYAQTQNLDLSKLDAKGRDSVIKAVVQETKVSPAVVRESLVSMWSGDLEGARQSASQLGESAGGTSGQRDISHSALGLRMGTTLDDPDMRGIRARTQNGRLREVRGDQLVRNNPSLQARAPELVDQFGDLSIDDLRDKFGELSLSQIARLTKGERDERLNGPGKSVYFNRLGDDIEACIRSLDPNGRAPLTSEEFQKLSGVQKRSVIDALKELSTGDLARVTTRGLKKTHALSSVLGGVDVTKTLDTEVEAIRSFLDKNWNVSLTVKDGAKVPGKMTLIEENAFTPSVPGLEGFDVKGDLLNELVRSVLVEGAKLGLPILTRDLDMQIDMVNMYADMANAYGPPKPFEHLSLDLPTKYADFSDASEKIIAGLKDIMTLRTAPKNYAAIKRGDKKPERPTAFEGADLHFRLGASSFDLEDSLAAGNVQYSDENQGRPPLVELVGAILRQGMNMTILELDAPLEQAVTGRREAAGAFVDANRPKPKPMTDERRAMLADRFRALLR